MLSDFTPYEIARFWKCVAVPADPDGCWDSHLKSHSDGYIRPDFGDRLGDQQLHRVSYALLVGPIPDGLNVLHTCDNKRCANPRHLYAGTQRDNARDALARGQFPRGERYSRSRLTETQVREIRALRETGVSMSQIAARYGVCRATIWHVYHRTWRHVD